MYDFCDECRDRIVRDLFMSLNDAPSYWLGTCGCPDRKWKWRSPSGDTPWELIG